MILLGTVYQVRDKWNLCVCLHKMLKGALCTVQWPILSISFLKVWSLKRVDRGAGNVQKLDFTVMEEKRDGCSIYVAWRLENGRLCKQDLEVHCTK